MPLPEQYSPRFLAYADWVALHQVPARDVALRQSMHMRVAYVRSDQRGCIDGLTLFAVRAMTIEGWGGLTCKA